MAKILLNVELNNTSAKKQLNELKNAIVLTVNSLNKIEINSSLTKQIQSLTDYYKALIKVISQNNNVAQQENLIQEKAALIKAKINTEEEKALNLRNKTTSAIQKNTAALNQNNESSKRIRQNLLSISEGFAEWQIASTLVMKALNLLKNTIDSLNNSLIKTENTIIEIQRVLNLNINNSELSDSLYNIAIQYGQTFENVSEIALNFAKSGRDWIETLKATEAAVLALNVAELNSTEASEGLIAIMQQFNIDADSLVDVIDKLNITADNSAVTTEVLLAALQRTGSTANNANISLEETIGLITALSEATNRSGENIGTALNSLIQFSKKESSLKIFSSLNDEMNNLVEKYRLGQASILDIWEGLSKNIKDLSFSQELFENSEFEDLEEELKESLGENFSMIEEIYGTAGTYRQNYFIALLANIDEVTQSLEKMNEAVNYSAEENKKYQESYEARLNSLQSKWEKLASDNEEWLNFKKILVEIGSNLLDIIENAGGLRTLLLSIGTLLSGLFSSKIIASIIELNKRLRNSVHLIDNIKTAQAASVKAQRLATQALSSQQEAIDALNKANQLRNILGESAIEVSNATRIAIEKETIATQAEAQAKEAAKAANAAWATSISAITTGIMAFATVISVIIGLIQQHNEEVHRANQEAITLWESNKKTADSLEELYKEYENLKKKNEDYSSIEEEIISLLDEKVKILQNLTKGTEEYDKALKNLINTELERYRIEAHAASIAAKEELEKAKIGRKEQVLAVYDERNNEQKEYYDYIEQVLKDSGINVNEQSDGKRGELILSDISKSKTVEAQLNNYKILSQAFSALNEAYEKAIIEGNMELADQIINSNEWEALLTGINYAQSFVDDYLKTNSAKFLNEYLINNNIENKDDLENAIQYILNRLGISENDSFFYSEIEKIVNSLYKIDEKEESPNGAGELNNELSKVKDGYEAILNLIKEKRDVEKEEQNILEAQNNLLEAQNNLLEAQNKRNVRVYNSQTGHWEWQANQKDVLEAQNNLLEAQTELENAAWTKIEQMFENGNVTNEAIVEFLKEIEPYSSTFWEEVRATIKKAYNIDIGESPYNSSNNKILNALATSNYTNNYSSIIPSNSNGLQEIARDSKLNTTNNVQTFNTNTNTNNNTTTYIVNGVPIDSKTADSYTLSEICNNLSLIINA